MEHPDEAQTDLDKAVEVMTKMIIEDGENCTTIEEEITNLVRRLLEHEPEKEEQNAHD